jgi:type IV pilus assembly protein PilY1
MNAKFTAAGALLALALAAASVAPAQTIVSEDFTRGTTSNSWYYFNGACLTAGTAAGIEPSGSTQGQIPGCLTASAQAYYNSTGSPATPHTEVQVGGYNGAAGNAQTLPDPLIPASVGPGEGALRFTNGYDETHADPYQGYGQNGQILSNWTFPSGQGLEITFMTVSYRGDSGGYYNTTANPGDGADGISFFLTDASQTFYPGAWGGSLGYSCSNSNPPYNGMTGAYLAVGLDEYGNFLNGSTAMPASAWLNGVLNPNPNTIGGDNTYYGYGERPDRIGIRGEGSVNWYTLNGAYGNNPSSSSKPYYPSSLTTSCQISGGTYNASNGSCNGCTTGTYNSTTNQCASCSNGTYNSGTNSCSTDTTCSTGTYDSSTGLCESCSTGTYDATTNKCLTCASNYTLNTPTDTECTRSGHANETPTQSSPTGTAPPTDTLTTTTPSTGYVDSVYAVKNTCATGTLYNYSTPTAPTSAGATTITNTVNTGSTSSSPVAGILPILDYAPIPQAYVELPETGSNAVHIAIEYAAGGYSRQLAKPIYYQLKLTQNGLLSLWYSLGGANGVFLPVIKSQSITGTNSSGTPSNGALPANFRFGFGGSDGGASNIHEILCFQAANLVQSASSAGANEKQSAKIETGVQAYFGYYNPNDSTGKLTAYALGTSSTGAITIAPQATWDASCVLTGSTACSTMSSTGTGGPAVTVEPPTSRVILTQNGTEGLAGGLEFEWSALTATQQASLEYGDAATNVPTYGEDRLSFLRGVRTSEIPSTGPNLSVTPAEFLRKRDSVLGDIQDSSPTWVGPPGAPYSATWTDRLYSSDTMPENTGTETYAEFASAVSSTNPGGEATRLNVVYVGSNDGMMHGFRTGAFNADGSYNTSAPNDGYEVLAYMPNKVVNDIHEAMDPPDPTATPPVTTSTYDATLDFTNPSYGHNFFVDSTPDADDLFYGGTWHTWLVSGQGAGGNSIFALDITDPTGAATGTVPFAEGNASSLVIGEWTGSTPTYTGTGAAGTPTNGNISCTGNGTMGGANCSRSLGNTYGTPQVRRMHNGQWAVIFGNGFGSYNGDAGIFIMLVNATNPKTTAPTFYYLSTSNGSPCMSTSVSGSGAVTNSVSTVSGTATGANGIGYTASVDLDGDHVIDYIYAGDLQGNLWRFDVTSSSPSNWAVTCGALFKTQTGQPITTQVVAASGLAGTTQQRLMIIFGTGQKNPATNTTAVSYAMAQQDLYGVWDWNLGYWNSVSSSQYASLSSSGVSGPLTANASGPTCGATGGNLACQAISVMGGTGVDAGDRDIDTAATICWAGTTTCGSSAAANQQFGWFLAVPGTNPATGTVSSYEQFIYNPEIIGPAVVINSVLPAANVPTSCTIVADQGWTYAVQALTGGALTNAFPQYYDTNAAGVETNATGGSFPIQNSTGQTYLVYQTVTNTPTDTQFNPGANTTAKRLTWVQRR